MATLGEGLIVAKDWGLTVILPALLVYALVYGLLTKYEVLGESEWANVMIATVLALMFVAVMKAVDFTSRFLPVVAAGLVVLFVFVLLIKFVGLDEGAFFGIGDKAKLGYIVLCGFILGAAIWAFAKVSPAAFDKIKQPFLDLKDAIVEPTVMSLIVLFGTLIVAAWFILRDVKENAAG